MDQLLLVHVLLTRTYKREQNLLNTAIESFPGTGFRSVDLADGSRLKLQIKRTSLLATFSRGNPLLLAAQAETCVEHRY